MIQFKKTSWGTLNLFIIAECGYGTLADRDQERHYG